MEDKLNKSSKNAEIMKGLVAIAEEANLKFEEVHKIYERFNYKLYRRVHDKHEEYSICMPELDYHAFECTARYFRISKLKNEHRKNN